jgi:hypothetical protein
MQQSDDSPLELNDQPPAEEAGAAAPMADATESMSRELSEQRDKYLRVAAEYDN